MFLGVTAPAQSETGAQVRAAEKNSQNTAPGALVKGRALFEDTGQPAPKERVQLVPIEALTNRRAPQRIPTTMTDANGDFTFAHPAAGEYYVVARPMDQHVSSAESAPFPLQTGDPVADAARLDQYQKEFPKITVNGQSPVEINLRVKNFHFGSISGRIIGVNGESVAGANVQVMKTGARAFGISTMSDDNGTYKFRGMPAGEYLVSASPPSQTAGPQRPRGSQGVLGSTYYPSTIDARMSPPVVVTPDLEVGDINVTLALRSLHSVSGTVRAEGDGHPVIGATVRLSEKNRERGNVNGDQPGIEAAMSDYFSTTDAQGHWLFSNLPDGTYTLSVQPTSVMNTKVERFVPTRQDLTVAGAEVQNLVIDVSLGTRVSGHVTVEPGTAPAPDISIGIGSAVSTVGPDGNFTVTGIAEGEFPLSVMIRPQNVFYPKSIEVNGIDLLREKLKTNMAAEIKDVRVVLAPASVLTGRVLSAAGKTPLSRVIVMLIPVDPSRAPAFLRPNGSTNDEGTFLLSGAPGEYFIVLWGRGEPLPPHDADSIQRSSPNARRVTLAAGERKSMDLVK
jgi:hypothetical protein